MKDGSTKKFIYDKVEYSYYINNEIIVYRPKDGTKKKIPIELVKKVYVRKFNAPATLVFTYVGAVVLYYAIALFGYMFRSHAND
jgi:hypothetical protein